MRIFLLLFFCIGFVGGLSAQDRNADLGTLFSEGESEVKVDERKGLYGFYKRHISDQIINDCIYEHSCSTFSKGAVKRYGIIKGFFLTGDRLMRCNRASTVGLLPVRISERGKIFDHWDSYTFKK